MKINYRERQSRAKMKIKVNLKGESFINSKIFKSYDIRGKYPEEVNEQVAYKIGQAFTKMVKQRRKVKKIDIVVGQDNRLSSPPLFRGLSQGIIDSGANVVSLGVCTAPMFYFASKHYKFDDGGIMITASHNPPQYNGFKIVKEVPIPIDSQTGLEKIKKMIIKEEFKISKTKGKIFKKSILQEYVKFNLKGFDFARMLPLRVVIDTGNTSSGIIIPEIFKKTKLKIAHLFPRLDGNYPNHPPDCLKKENLKQLQKEVLKKKADLGVAFDGDGDRIVFLDEQGKFISPNIITAALASTLAKENPGEKFIYTVRGSKIISEAIKEGGGRPVIWRVGHSYIKRKMRKDNILFGGEASGHYYLREHYFSEAPFFVLFKILGEMSQSKKKISELAKPFQRYFHSGEVNFKVKDKKKVLKTLEKKFSKGGKVLKIDGLRVDFPDWWFNVRPSHTEPVLRLVVEAKIKKLMEKKVKEIKSIILG